LLKGEGREGVTRFGASRLRGFKETKLREAGE
jgi:hypothetical protein